jgi:methyl-accepting chemotaxis protein
MTQRIDEVSAEAALTGQHCETVRTGAVALNGVAEELQHSVVRVVRSSTAEVDRRAQQRYQVNLPCRLSGDFGMHNARVIDLSSGGAAVVDAPKLAAGTRGRLEMDRVAMPLAFIVRSAGDRLIHLSFELDAAGTDDLAREFAQLGFRLAA